MPEASLDLIKAVRLAAAGIRAATLAGLSEYGLVPVHGAALRAIRDNGPCTHAMVASICGIERSNATAVIARLVQDDFVQRVQSSSDGRIWLLALTPEGTRFMVTIDEIWNDVAATLAGDVPKAEQRRMVAALLGAADRFGVSY